MAFLSYGQIKTLAGQVDRVFVEGLAKRASVLDDTKIVFLAHSSMDEEYLKGVIKFFKDRDAPVYIDKGDKNLPVTPSPITAEILKNNINACPRFVVLVSLNSKNSKWIPWELGLADGLKRYDYVALLPITPSSDEEIWAQQEYLGLYPKIRYGQLGDYHSEVWMVFNPKTNSAWLLENWLNPLFQLFD